MGIYTEGWNLTLRCLEKPLPIWGVSMECWKYITRESFDGKNIPVARTSGDAAQKRELWYAQLPLIAALSSNLAGIIGEQ